MNRYLKAVSSNLILYIVNTVFFLAIVPASVRLMGSVFYGLWAILYAMMQLTNIGSLGISPIVTKFASEAHPEKVLSDYLSEVLTAGAMIVLPMALLVATVLALSRNLITTHMVKDLALREQFSTTLLFVAASMFPQFLTQICQGFMQSQLKYRISRQIDVLGAISLWLGALLMILLFGKNLVLIGLWSLINAVLIFTVYLIMVRRQIPIKIHVNFSLIRKMLNFSGFMFFESVAISMFQQLDSVIVGFVLGPAIAGVYSIGTSISLRISMITGQITSVMVPFASLKDSLNDRARLYSVFRKLSKYVNLIVAAVGSLGILWMFELLALWISPAFAAQNSNAYRILFVAYSLLTLSRPAHQTLTGLGKVKFTSPIYLASTMIMLTGCFLLARLFGLTGAVWANVILGLLLVYNLYTYHHLAGKISWQAVLSDLQWGLLFPGATFAFVSLLDPSPLIRVAVSMLVLAFLGFQFYRDEWGRDLLLRILKQVRDLISLKVKSFRRQGDRSN